ncbi:MAG: PTS sugar transporter subunit IIC [Peptoniphilaceae bacterium]|nr:PTS sugar transporter subunit IIC [Peptoniphilaceae bacterium]MDY6147196.1 PTS sugar transporter subunit IIC [Peptoniphilaceae bacterium]
MNGVINFLLNDFLTKPVILIGLLICIGYLLKRESAVKTITGTISAMVGIQMVIFGGNQFTNTFKPIVTAVSEATGIQGYIMDSYAMKAASQEALGDRFGLMGYAFLIAFAVNILLVYFGKYTKAKGVFLTGNAGTAHAQSVLWLVLANLMVSNAAAVVITGVLVGVYWAYSTTLAAKVCDDVTGGAGFTIGHNQQIGIWFFGKIAHFFGNKEKDAENLKLPGWLSIFNNNVVATCVIMWIFVGGFMAPLGISGIQELAGKDNWIVYIISVGIAFSMDMVILLTGVRMMCAELTESFKGIQEKLVPNAIPAIDVAALLPFSPNAATLGFIFCTIGTVISIGILVLIKSPIMVLPGFVPLFFSGGPIGVVANRKGGIKAVIICCTLLGMIQSFGTIWAISLMQYPQGVGWSGMFDFSTVWPAITQIMKWLGSIFA